MDQDRYSVIARTYYLRGLKELFVNRFGHASEYNNKLDKITFSRFSEHICCPSWLENGDERYDYARYTYVAENVHCMIITRDCILMNDDVNVDEDGLTRYTCVYNQIVKEYDSHYDMELEAMILAMERLLDLDI